ncbi:unnamed protein product [Absidia cylindrospora]
MSHSTRRIAPISTPSRKASQSGGNVGNTKGKNERLQKYQEPCDPVPSSLQHTNNNSSGNSNTTEPVCAPSATPSCSSSTTGTSDLAPMQTDTTENVQVTVRCRPLSPKESSGKYDHAWHIDTLRAKIQLTDSAETTRRPQQQAHYRQQRQQKASTNKEYYFDNVAYGSDNDALYQNSVKSLIGQAMDGYNATVFAYGQTASGKTYMGTDSEPGIIRRAVDEIFSYIKADANNEFLLRVSYLEIYNETIRDLLAPENENLKIHENKQRGVYVTPMKEEVVTCGQDVLNVIQQGEGNRHISTTDYNLHSSRSHAIFQMVIESRQHLPENSTSTLGPSRKSANRKRSNEAVKISQLNLIDLAGSEKAASNQDRRKEGAYINKSLLTLGTVISKLTESEKSTGHIPYRDSKLTRILQPSLSGHAKVVVICTISPHIDAVDESINTLKFATRVKKIVLAAKNDAVMDDKALLQQYRGEIMDLKQKLRNANDVLLKEQQSKQSMIKAERKFEQELFQMRLVRSALKKRIDHLTKLILTSTSVPVPPAIDASFGDDINTSDAPAIKAEDDTAMKIDDDITMKVEDDEQQQCSTSQRSKMDITRTGPVTTTNNTNNNTVTVEDATNNPWVLVRKLRYEIHKLQEHNEELQQQLSKSSEQLEKMEVDLNDKVANLEAELSITKAERDIASQRTNQMNTVDFMQYIPMNRIFPSSII